MKVLVGCEYSAVVRQAFAKLGHDVWSCDLLPSEVAGNHIQGDIMSVLDGGWDVIILHPPCTKIGLCGNRHYGAGMPRHAERIVALDWTEALWKKAISVCSSVALEQPKSVLGQRIGKRSQAIHPYQFGHPEQKETWLWLHGLPPLRPTNNVYAEMIKLPRKERERTFFMSPKASRGHERSRTFGGIADAMAEQWSS
jgi:hypothetical protein